MQRESHNRRLKFIETYEFTEPLQAKFANAHNFISTQEQELVFSSLKDYFYICHQAGNTMVSMPSQIVDDAWHQFILFTKDYNDFCQEAFGHFLHHTPAEAMKTKTQAQAGIKRAWRIACRQEGINPHNPDRLPLIFAIDSMLEVENGFIYSLDCLAANNRISYCATHIGCMSGCGSSGGCSTSQDGQSESGCSTDGSSSHSCGSGCSSGCSGGCGGGCG